MRPFYQLDCCNNLSFNIASLGRHWQGIADYTFAEYTFKIIVMQTSINATPAGTYVLQPQQEQINAPWKMRRTVESQYAGLGQNKTSEAVELGKGAYK